MATCAVQTTAPPARTSAIALASSELTSRSRCASRCCGVEPRSPPTASTNASVSVASSRRRRRIRKLRRTVERAASGRVSRRTPHSRARRERASRSAGRLNGVIRKSIGKRVPRVDPLAMRDLAGDGSDEPKCGVDAARALRRSRRQAQQPAVVEELALRLQRVEPSLLDALDVDAPQLDRCASRHRISRRGARHSASTSSV